MLQLLFLDAMRPRPPQETQYSLTMREALHALCWIIDSQTQAPLYEHIKPGSPIEELLALNEALSACMKALTPLNQPLFDACSTAYKSCVREDKVHDKAMTLFNQVHLPINPPTSLSHLGAVCGPCSHACSGEDTLYQGVQVQCTCATWDPAAVLHGPGLDTAGMLRVLAVLP